MSGKPLRIATALMALVLWGLCFAVNFNASSAQAYGLKLLLTALFFMVLLLLSFLYGKQKRYFYLISGCSGALFLLSLAAILTRDFHSVWKLIFLDLPSLAFSVPFTPVFYLHDLLQRDWIPFILIIAVYASLSAAYLFGRRLIKSGNKQHDGISGSQGGA